MKIMTLAPILDSDIVATTIPEDDYAVWASDTTYAADAFVISTESHRVYQSVQDANTSNDPTADDGTWWTEVSRTAPYRPFDGIISSAVSGQGPVTIVIRPRQIIEAIAVFGMAASRVKIEVIKPIDFFDPPYDWWMYWNAEPDGEVIFTETRTMLDVPTFIYDEWTLLFADLSGVDDREALIEGFQAFPGQEIWLTFGVESEQVDVGEVLMGRPRTFGTTIDGTESEIKDFSVVSTDEFGNTTITRRVSSRPVTYEFVFPYEAEGRTLAALDRLRATPVVLYADEDLVGRGLMTYGIFTNVRLPHQPAGVTRVSLKVEGLI